jgi:hypothetical protein
MVNANTCGYANYNHERIAGCTYRGKLSRNGKDTIHQSKGYASSSQSADNHNRHVGIKSAIGMLMEFNICRN